MFEIERVNFQGTTTFVTSCNYKVQAVNVLVCNAYWHARLELTPLKEDPYPPVYLLDESCKVCCWHTLLIVFVKRGTKKVL